MQLQIFAAAFFCALKNYHKTIIGKAERVRFVFINVSRSNLVHFEWTKYARYYVHFVLGLCALYIFMQCTKINALTFGNVNYLAYICTSIVR